MKIRNFCAAIAAFAILVSIASCGDDGKIKFKTFETRLSEPLAEGDTVNAYTFSLNLQYPVSGASGSIIKAMRDNIIEAALGASAREKAIGSAAEEFFRNSLEEYRKINLPLASDGYAGMMSWEDLIAGEKQWQGRGVLSYILNSYTYTGGVHGLTMVTGVNLSLEDGHELMESEIFKPGYIVTLNRLLTERLHYAFDNESDYDALFVKDIETNGNFLLEKEGVSYIYNQYEIAPYSLGVIYVTIPWTELEDILAI